MKTESQPLVSVVTPLYNCAENLAECIESVLGQTYSNWDYTIVNNASTDESLAVAQKYAAKDPRIRVIDNDRFLNIVENHNKAIRQISPASKYCKFVLADDWLYPNCIEQMVQLAEEHPSLGIVSAYMTNGSAVVSPGPKYPSPCLPGLHVGRRALLGEFYLFGSVTGLMLRSDLVLNRKNVFNEQNLHSDTELCIDLLQRSDFGYIHQVLSFGRPREQSAGTFAARFDSLILGQFVLLRKYGPVFLKKSEFRKAYEKKKREYHLVLAQNILRVRPKEFWKYHENALLAVDEKIDRGLLLKSVLIELADHLSHPFESIRLIQRWWSPTDRQSDQARARALAMSSLDRKIQ